MSQTSPKMNWPYIAFVVVAGAAGLGCIGWAVTSQAIKASRLGMPIPGGWTWPSVIGVDLICAAAFIALLWKIYCDWKTVVTDEYVSQPSLFGTRLIRWCDLTKVTTYGYGIHIHGPNERIIITPYAYRDPKKVIAEISERIKAKSTSDQGPRGAPGNGPIEY